MTFIAPSTQTTMHGIEEHQKYEGGGSQIPCFIERTPIEKSNLQNYGARLQKPHQPYTPLTVNEAHYKMPFITQKPPPSITLNNVSTLNDSFIRPDKHGKATR